MGDGSRIAIVTGGAGGLGRAIAQRLIEGGTFVVLADKSERDAKEVAHSLGDRATYFACDVTLEDEVTDLFSQCISKFGNVNILVNNAGITRDAMIHRMSLDDFQLVLDVHLRGAWLCSRAALSFMRGREGGGCIVNLSSISGKVGNPGQSNYSTAKAGMIGLTKATAKEGARFGIRVNAVVPGLIRTKMTQDMPAEVLSQRLSEIPLGRMGEPEEVAAVVAFLCSNDASYLTGVSVEISGGRHM